ncbi:MAG: TetR/AcrR family transcriptional regulator [Bacteroidota bacterium]
MDSQPLPALSERKQQILNAARDLFSHKGYGAASMRDLAKVMDIKPASLYSHYDSKEDILWEIAIRAKEAFFQKVLPLAEGEGNIEERLRSMLQAHVGVIIDNINASAIFFGEWKHLSDPRRSEFAAYQEAYEQAFRELVNKGISSGTFRDQNTRFGVRSLLAGINWIHKWYKADGRMKSEEIAEQAADFGLAALR